MNDRNSSYGSAPSFDAPDKGEVSDPFAETAASLSPAGQGQAQGTAGSAKEKGKEVADTAKQKAGKVSDKASEVTSKVQDKASVVTDTAKDKASEVGDKAQEKSDQGIDKAATGLGQAAEMLRQQGEQRGGTVASAATVTAEKLDGASQYLKDKDTGQLLTDLEALVRERPVESLLVAAGAGFLLSKIFS